jgi:hypothetical protein
MTPTMTPVLEPPPPLDEPDDFDELVVGVVEAVPVDVPALDDGALDAASLTGSTSR